MTFHNQPNWPADRTARLIALRKAGVGRTECARVLGVTLCAINGKLDRLKAERGTGSASWERVLTETWAERKARLAGDRARVGCVKDDLLHLSSIDIHDACTAKRPRTRNSNKACAIYIVPGCF